ncbi:N-acetyltransferase [Methylomonas sp. LW13]|uniref:GNAT family N-acetyltransferase n=1 Tax=unclassified Methylomonas TaxID=2608980 RepID=UPI00051C4A67|nr:MULTISPECIES: GNAT family N-acetyltransferase [unclassified Methylomonas]PKD39721.1 N-acetyltransferase [Methylomonas sp. Kb3]QBC27847.1 N-acetyltransferase [Methylomonas sp. LW13]
MEVKQIASMAQIEATAWNRLCGPDYPFLRHEFLAALEQSAAVCPQTGWETAHLLVFDNKKLLAALPLYLKTHSWGEYVFDQQWAQAYQQHGLAYYPKLISAIPFTPCQGQRLLFAPDADQTAICALLFSFIQQLAERQGISSWHCLFPEPSQLELLRSLGLSVREGVQFQWFNRGYATFTDFLQTLSADKRKMIKRERRRVAEQGIELLRVPGTEVAETQWQVFFRFYALTYLKRSSEPYLNLAFFKQIARTMPEQLLLVLAMKDDVYVGAALSFIGADTLYGRYWGCDAEYNALHFEACYYQGLDYCIEHGLARFDSGAQGEHKISRGFEPVTTYSTHWLKDAGFAKAVAQFVAREKQAIAHYKQDAANYLPFKRAQ